MPSRLRSILTAMQPLTHDLHDLWTPGTGFEAPAMVRRGTPPRQSSPKMARSLEDTAIIATCTCMSCRSMRSSASLRYVG